MTRGGPAQLLQTSVSNRRGEARLAGFPTGKQRVIFRTGLWMLTVAWVNTLAGGRAGWHSSRRGAAGNSGGKLPHTLQKKNEAFWLPELYRKGQQTNLSGSQGFSPKLRRLGNNTPFPRKQHFSLLLPFWASSRGPTRTAIKDGQRGRDLTFCVRSPAPAGTAARSGAYWAEMGMEAVPRRRHGQKGRDA